MKKRLFVGILILTIFGCTLIASADAIKVGYLWSEKNAARYNWAFQDKALELLDIFEIKYDKLSDKAASDVKTLSKYDVITGICIYALPDEVVDALVEYVKGGGKLVLSEPPVAAYDPEIAKVLGFADLKNTYYNLKDMTFTATDKNKLDFKETFAAAGSTNGLIRENMLDTAEVWITAKGLMARSKGPNQEGNIDALIVNRYGKGIGVLLNWNVATTGDLDFQIIYVQSILWAAEQ